MTQRTRRLDRGVTLAMVLIAAIVATMLWANSYSLLHSQVKLHERARAGYTGGIPDRGAATAWAIACLRVAEPTTSGTPPTSRCTLTLGTGANERKFGIRYIDRGTGSAQQAGGKVWEIEVTDGDQGWAACASCPGAGGF